MTGCTRNIMILIILVSVLFLFAQSKTIEYQYDNLSRLTRVDFGNGRIIEYNYDAVGNRIIHVVNAPTTVYTDAEPVTGTGAFQFNEPAEGGDGHGIDMLFTSLTGSGNVTVQQTNALPANAPCSNSCGCYWDISKEAGITSFSADITFHYTNSDATGYAESQAYWGCAKFNSSTNTWQWLGGSINAGNNTLTISGVTTFSTFALYRRIFGDCTGDGYVDAADLQRLGDCWHQTNSNEFTAGTNARFFNCNKNTDAGNQIIDAADLQVFGDCWHNGIQQSLAKIKDRRNLNLKEKQKSEN